MTSLILTLPLTAPSASTLCQGVLTEDGNTVLQTIETTLAQLPPSPALETVVIVPAAKLSWHQVELPQGALKGSARLRTILEGLLEENLLDEPAQLHFALGPQAHTGQPLWVAACERAWLYAWLAALEQVGKPAARIVPELTPPAPLAPETAKSPASASISTVAHLQAIGTPEHAQLLLVNANGVSVLPLSAPTVHWLAWPPEAPLLAEPSITALTESHFKRPVSVQTRAQRQLAAAQSDWDLAQFDLLQTQGARTRKHLLQMATSLLRAPCWRAARWATLALLLINLAGLQMWAWQQQAALAAQRAAIRDTLVATFPEIRVVVDAPQQMTRALTDLQRRNGTATLSDLETMLGQFQSAAPGLVPNSLEFSSGELRLKQLTPPITDPSHLIERLQAQGYSAQKDGDALILQERRP